jgi:AcrR family transcriptional regulator
MTTEAANSRRTSEPEAGARSQGRVARRRAAVRRRILEVAEELIADRGVEGVTIEDITEAADIARRTFYHHFDSKHEILVPIAHARTKALNRRIDALVAEIDDPAEVMATAMRHGLRGVSADPLCRWFVLHSGLPQERLHEGMGESGTRDALRAVEAGRFHVDNLHVALLLTIGAFIAIVSAHAEGKLDDADLDDAVEHMLRVFGMERSEARDLAHRPLPRLPADVPSDDSCDDSSDDTDDGNRPMPRKQDRRNRRPPKAKQVASDDEG